MALMNHAIESLSGRRLAMSRWIRRATVVLAATAITGYVMPSHAVWAEDAHSYLADLGWMPLIAYVVAAIVAVWAAISDARGRGYLVGATAIAAVGATIVAVADRVPHMFQTTTSRPGDVVAAVGFIGLAFAGLVSIVSEIVLYRLERRATPVGLAA